jgi:AcrR family transcriptional regulator
VAVAKELIYEQGFHGVGVADLMEAAGLSNRPV